MNKKLGIFWVIGGTPYYNVQEKDVEKEKQGGRSALTGIVDSDFSHFEEWDKALGRRFPRSDFATFPRGRVVYDVRENKTLIYADECISAETLTQIAKAFGAENYQICRDEHYSCDRCISRKGLFD